MASFDRNAVQFSGAALTSALVASKEVLSRGDSPLTGKWTGGTAPPSTGLTSKAYSMLSGAGVNGWEAAESGGVRAAGLSRCLGDGAARARVKCSSA